MNTQLLVGLVMGIAIGAAMKYTFDSITFGYKVWKMRRYVKKHNRLGL